MTPQEKRKYPQEMLLMGGCPNCGQEINRKFVEDVIDEIIDLALAEERKKIIEMIDKFEAEPLLMTSSTNMPCICGFENGDIIELDENNRHKTCGKPLPLIVPMKTPAQKLKEFLTKDEDIAHLTSLKNYLNKYMEKLIGKTIKSIEQPAEMDIIDVDGYEVTRYDDNIKITFTDGTVLKLSSWDFEGYCSGIYKQIITN